MNFLRKNILEYLEDAVKTHPYKIAFSDENHGYNFFEVYDIARRIGSYITSVVGTRECVAIFMDRSVKAIIAFLGVVYAGCFYVCIDANAPIFQIRAMFDTTMPKMVICDKKFEDVLESVCCDVCRAKFCDALKYTINEVELDNIRREQTDADIIYIVFTSGSTGVPKGVCVSHASVIDYTEALCETLGFDENCVFACQSPLFSDAPLKEIMTTLKCGCTTYLVPSEIFKTPYILCDFLNSHKINAVCWVPTALSLISSLGLLEKNKPMYLDKICFMGEEFSRGEYLKWRAAYPKAIFCNLYGPTEATGTSCFWVANREIACGESIPIGNPFPNTQILLIDQNGNIVSKEDTCKFGEIYIKGRCLSNGYYNDPVRSNNVFVQNPLNELYRDIVYKTGDIAKYNEFGELVFVCRADLQVKRRGRRIELTSIESIAKNCGEVISACCIYFKANDKIVLFYTGDIDNASLYVSLKTYLPKYHLPDRIVQIKEMPTTPTGKTDRNKLFEMYN